ncbi:amidohydrolase [Mangrovimicrobium sediminis]|uniref:5-methylthioadenosine/S-adenosylhomocysteine deaminase n=1 Tax=Mangrovimicrobium sediminis TaxID=2562682 RepID=A0A4Z0M0D9_9GAMM|nr:amidohydrolase family protein [Haliea sp. SAOS-164]TGD73001.1 amidohydrolase [Haliea sp. SAOS-164]
MRFHRVLLLVLATCFGASARAADVDLIVYGDYLLSMVPGEAVLEDAAIAIRGDSIVAVGARTDIDAEYSAPRSIPGADRVILPGLVNGHTHTSMTLFRGMVDDLDLMTWLQQYVFPMEGRFVTPEFVRTGSELACWEMIRGGTTTFVDMYFYPDEIAGVVQRCGLRAVIGAPHIDYPSPGFEGWDDSFAAARDFVGRWQGKDPRITPAFAPHAPYTVSPEHLQDTVAAARKAGAPITMHLAEAPAESAYVSEHFQTTPIKHVKGLGMFETPLIGAHMIQLDAEDIALVAAGPAPVGAVHNPTSNMKLGAGISPVPAMLAAGINVGLGTDGAASNNDLDLWEEIRLAALLHKVASGDPTALPAPEALAMATRTGAAAIGLGEYIGQLKPGMQADLIQVDLGKTRHQPRYDIVSHLVYVLDSTDVQTTVVAGQVLMRDRQVQTIDEAALRKAVAKAADGIRAALAAPAEG